MSGINSSTNLVAPRVVAVAGASGSVSGNTTASAVQSVTLFTAPASPTDVEYLVDIGGIVGMSGTSAYSESVASATGAVSVIQKQVRVGAGQAVAVCVFGGTSAVPYVINYRSIGYRAA
jgi:hypothetical protein